MNAKTTQNAMIKRAADAIEKLGIASLVIGSFQEKELGLYIGAGCW